jgi:Holliday junction resolvase RusA-like endonuclease
MGPPRTKKNHGFRTKQGHQMPSHAYTAWNRIAQTQLAAWRSSCRVPLPITDPVNCRATFFREANRGDAVGYYQALADTLEAAGIVENDRLIVSWDGSRLAKDSDLPRVEIVLEVQ